MRLRSSLGTFLIVALGLVAAAQRAVPVSDAHSAAYRSIQQKLAYLKLNASRAHPDPKPAELTEAEVNAYFNEGGVKLPNGVSGVRLASRPGVIDGRAHVDFEPIMQGRNQNNPLYSLFSGQHEVHVVADGEGTNGVATIKVQTVEMDDVAIPQWALEFFLQHYITPKYHNVGMTSTFPMPLRVQTATVEAGKVRLEQR
jgi:hypothetical protein